jgi:hypothetical protein
VGILAVGARLTSSSHKKIAKILLVFFAVLFAAILIHPEWDLPEVHDVKITSARHQSQCAAERPIQPVMLTVAPLIGITQAHKWCPTSVSAILSASPEPLPNVLRV